MKRFGMVVCWILASLGWSVAQSQPPTTVTKARAKAVLLGERPDWAPDGQAFAVAAVATTCSAILGMDVVDMTMPKETVAQAAARTESIWKEKPNILILFVGRTDEKAGTDDGHVREGLKKLGLALAQGKVAGFVVPSSTSLKAGTSGILRVGATGGALTFIEPGAALRGRPYEEAMGEIRGTWDELVTAHKAAMAAAAQPAAAAPATSGPAVAASGASDQPITLNMQPPPAIKAVDPKAMKPHKSKGKTKRPEVEGF